MIEYTDILYDDPNGVHDQLCEIASVSKKIKAKTYIDTTMLIMTSLLTKQPARIDAIAVTTGNLFKRRVGKRAMVKIKIRKCYADFKSTYLTHYDMVDAVVNIMLVNTTTAPIPFAKAVGYLNKHKLISSKELAVLRLFNQYRNLLVHNNDIALCDYLIENISLMDNMMALMQVTMKFIVDNNKKLLFKALYIVNTELGESPSDVNMAALKESQRIFNEPVVGDNIHLSNNYNGVLK